ncbi:MAG: hypothetical protein JSW11_10995 [Candidatus Heimdallarchaeota archaeon]|nr:MAG: hypothetical protein JSW11_10995 [Candidatus Heimdallarchaeota archaeon]
MRTSHLEALLCTTSLGKARKLLIVSCSATKDPEAKDIPAILRYSGEVFLILKSIISNSLWPQHIDLIIVSAKFGLLNPLDKIPYYDEALKMERISFLKKMIKAQVKTLDLTHYSESFMNLSKRYFQSIEGLIDVLEKLNCNIIQVEREKRNNAMLAWLVHD